MRYVYLDDSEQKINITTAESTDHGVFLGTISEEDFSKVDTRFLVQALMNKAGYSRSGLSIELVHGLPTSS